MQVFTPPYLYARDGSGNLASRPSVSLSQTTVALDATFTVASPDAARITKVGLVRLGAPTHSQDQSQRYVPLSYTAGTGTLTIAAPANPAEAPPGYYMLFAVDSDGVPAVAPIIKVTGAERGSATVAGARNGSPAAVAYRDVNRAGTQQPFEPGSWLVSKGGLGLIGNDTMSSIDVANGWQATICTNDLLVGCTDLGPGVHNTLPTGYDNAVSSLRITPKDATNGAPVAVATATPTSGTAPLTVQFSGAGSSDPDGTPLTYAWDLDGDGAFDDSTGVSPSFTYLTASTVTAALRVSDGQLTAVDSVTVTVTPGVPADPVGEIFGVGSGKCLDINPNKKDKTVVSVWTCSASPDQQWTLKSNGTIVNSLSKHLLVAARRHPHQRHCRRGGGLHRSIGPAVDRHPSRRAEECRIGPLPRRHWTASRQWLDGCHHQLCREHPPDLEASGLTRTAQRPCRVSGGPNLERALQWTWPSDGGRHRGPRLDVPQVRVGPSECEQLVVRAGLDDPAGVEHPDPVRVADGRESVRHDDRRAPEPPPSRSDRWIAASVSLSTALVASSRTSTRGSRSSARASARRCRCPPERVTPRSPTQASSPSGSASMNSSAAAASAAPRTSSRVASGRP